MDIILVENNVDQNGNQPFFLEEEENGQWKKNGISCLEENGPVQLNVSVKFMKSHKFYFTVTFN